MAQLFGKKWTRKQLMERIGNPGQIATVRPHTLTNGKAKGVSAVEFSTGSGFRFTVLPDRALDICAAEYGGRSLCWHSTAGVTSPHDYQPEGLEWLYSFFGGLLTTCGLTHFGAPCVDEGKPLGLHGRVSSTPAEEVSVESGWQGDDYLIGVRGKVIESSVFGPKLCLTRSIFAFLGQKRLFIHDEVANIGFAAAPHMMLYHINLGFPVVDAGSRLIVPSVTVTPRDAEAEDGKKQYASFVAPTAGWKEKCYFHDVAAPGDQAMAAVVNPALGFGAYMLYKKSQLPQLIEWKQMGKGDYVVGVEPGTNLVRGRDRERAEGRLRMLQPGETATYDLELGALISSGEIAAFEKQAKSALRGKKTRIV